MQCATTACYGGTTCIMLIKTIESDDEIEPEIVSDDENNDSTVVEKTAAVAVAPSSGKKDKGKQSQVKGAKKKVAAKPKATFTFQFDDAGDNDYDNSVDESDDDVDDEEKEDDGGDEAADNIRAMPRTEERAVRALDKMKKKEKRKLAEDDEEGADEMGAAEEREFFDSVEDFSAQSSSRGGDVQFSQLNLSRPLLRAIEAAGYVSPTPVQARVIPLAMAGRDVCASAVTGSGKTAAFILPFLERLLYRPKEEATIRVLVVSPTRELATQTYTVLKTLAQFTDITCAIICGGTKDVKSQEVTLRNRPDIVVCTPGRFIDHLRNSHSVSIDDLDILVLDEVDRLLDMGFQEEVEELVKYCPVNRQTLLFSATMTAKVNDLAKLSLKRPVRVKTASTNRTIAPRLIQEFVKVKSEDEKEAMLCSLVCRSFGKRCIVFFETKKDAHRFCMILTLLNVKVSELHGDISQSQRYVALQKFKDCLSDVLVCTDVAARGLDIQGIQTVINAEMPRQANTYVHRVGRTARAGCGGRSITLVTDGRRKVMKDILKGEGSTLSTDGGQVLSRLIPANVVTVYEQKIVNLESEIEQMVKNERTEARLARAEEEANRADNVLTFEDEIVARPPRTWYQTEREKTALKAATKEQAAELSQKRPLVDKRQTANSKYLERIESNKPVNILSDKTLTADQKLAKLMRSDSYDIGSKDVGEGKHRLSRKKKRKQEALRSMEEDGVDIARSVNSAPKRAKMTAREKELEIRDRSVADMTQAKKTREGKVIRQTFAVGGLDQDMYEWGGGSMGDKESKKKKRAVEKELTDFDPDKKLRKQGKVGRAAFKSKSKFKRRK